jgi:hypothetical protein
MSRTLVLLFMLPVLAVAATIDCATSPSTLDYYINSVNVGGGCSIDQLTFSNFSFTPAAGQTSNPTDDDILVTAIDGNGTTDPGFIFSHTSGAFSLNGPHLSMNFTIAFTVTADEPYRLYGATLFSTFNQTSSGNNASVNEVITHDGGKEQMMITQGQNGPKVRFFPYDSSITVENTWRLQTGGNAFASAAIGDVHQTYTATPEPMTLVLTAIPLFGMCLLRRFRR